jgi:hypothetical protein
MASKAEQALPWPGPVKLVGLDPVALGLGCGGADAYCSTSFSKLWSAFRGPDGSVMDRLIGKYAPGVEVGRVAFLGFSAAHGFLNPMLNNDRDRARTSAVVMMDTCFGSGKTGFIKALQDAAAGRLLYATFTSHPPGAKFGSAGVLQSGTECFEQQVLTPSGLHAERVAARPPMFEPKGGAWQIGDLGFWLRGTDNAGTVDVAHYNLSSVQQRAMIEAYLLPYWRGELGSALPTWAYALIAAAAVAGGGYLLLRKKIA